MKKIIALIMAISMLSFLASCGEKKTLTCDVCGKDGEVEASSNMTDDWTVYCSNCEKDLGLDTIVE